MRKPDKIIIGGKAYSWKSLCEQRRPMPMAAQCKIESDKKVYEEAPAMSGRGLMVL